MGRPKRTEEEEMLIAACREKTPEALSVIESLMRRSQNDRVRLAAAQFIIERGWGKAPERIELATALETRVDVKVMGRDITPAQAYARIIRGECVAIDDLGGAPSK